MKMPLKDQPVAIRRFYDTNFYNARVSSQMSLHYTLFEIKSKLNKSQLKRFEDSCFRHFLGVNELEFSGQIINHMLFRQCVCNDPTMMKFNFGGIGARFTRQEFRLITGLECGLELT